VNSERTHSGDAFSSGDERVDQQVSQLADYREKYSTIRMERDADGVLELTFHSYGDSLQWTPHVH
jgi:hypothetical protein